MIKSTTKCSKLRVAIGNVDIALHHRARNLIFEIMLNQYMYDLTDFVVVFAPNIVQV